MKLVIERKNMKANEFKLYGKDNAPEESPELLCTVETKFGFIPNVLLQMAESSVGLAGTL